MKNKRLVLFILTGFLCFMLTACGRTETAHNADTGSETPDAGAQTPTFSVLPGESSQEDASPEVQDTQKDDQNVPTDTVPEDPTEAYIRALLDSMSDAQLAGQMVLCACPAQDASALLSAIEPAGLILFGKNIDAKTPEMLSQELAEYQRIAAIPLLIAADEEGGTVARVSAYPAFRASRFRSPRKILAEDGEEGLAAEMKEKAQLLTALGINVNLAPVVDLASTEGSFMYARALPGSVEEVCNHTARMVKAMEEEGLGTVLKHFPGYGENGDTHSATVYDDRAADAFYAADLLPFQAGIEAGSRAVLVSHNIVEAFDAQDPASLSAACISVLREVLGQDVVAMTDDLQMEAISGQWTLAEAAVLAVEAGEDLVVCFDGMTAAAALAQALEDGRISRARAEESVRRVLLWKLSLGLLTIE